MKLIALIAVVATLSACTSTQLTAAGANAAAVNGAAVGALQGVATSIAAACPAGQVIVTSIAAADPTLSVAALGNGLFCAANKAIAATAPAAK